jgi:hypothetical protein
VMGAEIYDRESLFPAICDEIAKGVTLREICRREGMPNYSVVYDWINENREFAQRFARARELGFDQIAEETMSIADDATNDWMEQHDPEGAIIGYRLNGDHVQRSKLRIETRLKLLAKWDPKRYGDRLDLNHSGKIDGTALDLSKLSDEKLAQLRSLATEAQPDAPSDS